MFRSISLPGLVVIFVVVVIWVVPFWKTFSKAGYPGVLALTMFVPLVNIAVIYWFGFSQWPVLKELKALRQRMPSLS